MIRRAWAIALLLGFAALAAFVASATPASAAKCPHPPFCGPPVTLLPTPSADPGDSHDTPAPTPTATANFSRTEVLSLAQPTSTPPAVPDSGFAESQPVSQADPAQGTLLGTSAIPTNNDSFAAAPGFGPIGVPLVLAFALLGLVSLTILKRI